MRKAFHKSGSNIKNRFFFLFALALTCAIASPGLARGSSELDRQFALEAVGFLRSWDNVDGLFADYVAAAYKDYFQRQSRFVLQDLSKADTVLSKSKLSYQKLIDDPAILSQVARSTRSESIIRTKILKEGSSYQFKLEWLHSPGMEIMSSETFQMAEPADGKTFGLGDVKETLEQALERMIAKLPFSGNVTGRDNHSVTVNIGALSNLKPGDTLVIATLEEVKKHPLLKAIVDWRFTRTGKIELTNVDDRISFGKVIEEEAGRSIARYQKIVQVIPRPVVEAPVTETSEPTQQEEPPRLGWISAGPWLGTFSRQYTTSASLGRSGSGFLFGANADGQLWLTRSWFVEAGFGFGNWSYSQKDIQTGVQSALTDTSGRASAFHGELGYSYLVGRDLFGPRGWLKLGYRSTSYTLPIVSSELLSPVSFNSVFLGLGGELPVTSEWGALLGMSFGLFASGSDSAAALTINSASDIAFFFGAYYRFNPKMMLRFGLDIFSQGADYSNRDSLSHKIFAFAPGLLYYF